MDKEMGGAFPTDKLDRSNYASWDYNIHQFVLGHGYMSTIHGENETMSDSAHKDFSICGEAANRILCCLASFLQGQMLGYILDTKTSKEA